MLRGRDVEVSANLGHLSNHLDIASELGVGPAQTPRECNTPSSSGPSPLIYQTSPTVPTTQSMPTNLIPSTTPVGANHLVMPGVPNLLPSLPVEGLRRAGPACINTTRPAPQFARPEPATADFTNLVPAPPPLVHSHSFPNGHQLPSQLHGMTPSTPIIPSASFTASLGIAHAPHISSPLTSVAMSRPPSPLRAYQHAEQPWPDMALDPSLMTSIESDLILSRRASQVEGRSDGRPVVQRARSTSVKKDRINLPRLTTNIPPTNMPPITWYNRQQSSEEEEDDESEDEEPRRTKRRRSSAGRDDAPDFAQGTGPFISEDIRRQLDQIFEEFLNRVCSDRECLECSRDLTIASQPCRREGGKTSSGPHAEKNG